MGRRRKAKFQIGDTVVITLYGTVGKVTNVQWLEGTYVYEINRSDELYKEENLQLLSEYEGELFEKEHIDIEYKFLIGDIVQVTGYPNDFYKIVGLRTEIWRYKESSWEDIVYELSRVSDGERIEADEDDLVLIADVENAEAFLQKLGILYLIQNQKDQEKRERSLLLEKRKITESEKVNHLLDIYNDYRFLYEWFKDEEYEQIMKAAIIELKKITDPDNIQEKRNPK
jgi:hypothetical protein